MFGIGDGTPGIDMDELESELSGFQSECVDWYKTGVLSPEKSGVLDSKKFTIDYTKAISTEATKSVKDKMRCCSFGVMEDSVGEAQVAMMIFHSGTSYKATWTETMNLGQLGSLDAKVMKSILLPPPAFWTAGGKFSYTSTESKAKDIDNGIV